jgi:hypothetical protein
MLKLAAETVLPFKRSDPEGHSYRYFLAWIKANGATSTMTRASGDPSDCTHVVTKPAARNQDVAGQRTMFSHPGKERWRRRPFLPRRITGPIALVPICHGYKLQVAGCGLRVAGWELRVGSCGFAVADSCSAICFLFPGSAGP